MTDEQDSQDGDRGTRGGAGYHRWNGDAGRRQAGLDRQDRVLLLTRSGQQRAES